MSTSSEARGPGSRGTRRARPAYSMVVIVAVIALVFWPSFSTPRPEHPAAQPTTGLAAPHQSIVVNGEVCVQCSP